MGDGPRRRCAQAWAWVYLALFDNGEDATDTEAASTGHDGESTQATSDEPETEMSGADLYLLTVYMESQRGEPPVASGVVADRLDKSPPSVTEIVQRLDDQGLVVYEPYEGATLTDAGRERGTDLHQSYVTLSWFFRGVLELETHESEAMEPAGVIDPTVSERLTTVLPVEELQEQGGI